MNVWNWNKQRFYELKKASKKEKKMYYFFAINFQ